MYVTFTPTFHRKNMDDLTTIEAINLLIDDNIDGTTNSLEEETDHQGGICKLIALAVAVFHKKELLQLQLTEPDIAHAVKLRAESAFKTAWQHYLAGYCDFFQTFIDENASQSTMKSDAKFIFTDYSGQMKVNDFRRYLVAYFDEQATTQLSSIVSSFRC